jgi:DNA-binding response OmpR family regulator
MIKILLYTKNKINKSKINEILESKDFTLQVEKTFNNLHSRPEDTSIIILDITLKDEGDDIPIKNIIKAADKYDINKFIILNPDQANYLFKSEIKFNDFVFNTRLEEELFLRIKAILLETDLFSPKNSIVVDRLVLNLDKYELSINEKLIELTFKEFELFKILLQNQNKVFTRNKLLSTVWEYDFYGGSRTVDVHMRRLRSKIPSPYNLMLKTVRNVGYMFSPQI